MSIIKLHSTRRKAEIQTFCGSLNQWYIQAPQIFENGALTPPNLEKLNFYFLAMILHYFMWDSDFSVEIEVKNA